MKRLLSTILALAMLITIVPTAFATGEATNEPAGITVVYNFKAFEGSADSGTISKAIEYDDTYGFWMWRKNYSREITMKSVHLQYNVRNDINNSASDMDEDDFFLAFEIDIPVSGLYDVTLNNRTYKSYGATAKLYIIPASTANGELALWMKNPDNKSFGDEFSFCDSTLTKWGESDVLLGKKYFEAGKYVFAYAVTGVTGTSRTMFVKGITLDGDGETAANYVPIISSLTATENEGVTTVKAETKLMSDAVNSAEDATITYTVATDDATLAEVDATTGVVTGLADGTATIIATATKNGLSSSKSIEVTVTAPSAAEPGEEVTDTKVSVAVQPENTDEGTVSWGGATIDEVNMGDTVSATATAKEGYVFRYWKNSAGQVISDNPNESFVINTNSAITAVFDKIDDTANTVSVELYNANGMPFDNRTVNKNTTFADAISGVGTPTYTGFGTFKYWSMYEDESKIADNMLLTENTRAVAIFNAPSEKYTVKVNDVEKHKDVLYGTEVTVFSDAANFSCWKLGEKIVSYKPQYTFTVWGDVNLTEVTGETVPEAPVATLTTIGSNPLLIYSVPAGYTKIEAGILFGSTADISIYSVDGSRAAEARGTGQFTAQPKANSASAYARGYLIFKNNTTNEIRIIYAD